MEPLIVVNNTKDWPLKIPGVRVVDARTYLTGGTLNGGKGTLVFNLCRSYRYQSDGYYVSLLAAARGHRPLPSSSTIQDMKSLTVVRYVSEDLEELIQQSLRPLQSNAFALSVYFGRNVAKRYDRLSRHLFNVFHAPLFRVYFAYNGKWEIQRISPIGVNDIPEEHRNFVVDAARTYFARRRYAVRKTRTARYDLAILYNPNDATPASNELALRKFQKAAHHLGLETEVIEKEDYGRLAEFDGLFIRETTYVNHHTFRFSQRAAAEGLVVIDDPESILRCTNKVYLAELLTRYHVCAPKTVIVHRDNLDAVPNLVGFPCVLKQPDSSFSQGVIKVHDEAALTSEAERLLEKSELIIAQEFIPTPFDWRVGIIDRQPLYVCRYYMARKHWQIQKTGPSGKTFRGRSDTLPVHQAPPQVVRTALRAANLIGDGLYGVDLKQWGRHCYVIEVNDNPSIDAGVEDLVLKDDLYRKIMQVFLERIERKKQEKPHP